MPAVRLLALAPAPGQQLQLLRSAGSASSSSTTRTTTARESSYTKDSNGRPSMKSSASSSSSRAMSTTTAAAAAPLHPPTQPSWCRGASPAVSLFHTRAQRPTTASGANASSQRAGIHQQQPRATSRAFGSATMPKQVAFPRHGKAVAPQETPTTEKDGASTTTEEATTTATQTPPAEEVKAASAASSEAAPEPTEEKKPAKKNGKRTKAAAAAEAKAKEAAAATPAEQTAEQTAASAASVKPASSTEPTDSTKAPTSPGPSSAAVDAQKTLGRTDGADPGTIPSDPAGVVAEAAAAATTAAETASVAADMLGGASPVIELGPPKVTIGAILEPGQGEQDQSDQQQQEQQQGSGDQASSPSQRHSLSQNKLLPPHLAPPPYVHHFDSYSLVKQLEGGGYKQEQAITAMKAVRSLLAQNLDVAQAGLVSKSDVENEAYLFKAACAELSIEVRNNRRRADELVRQQRTLLQHEVDIAAQSVNQELVTLADVVKELFNDRKMAVREEQKALESAIQQLSYKITIMLNSEMRSEIEGLRWVLIRRSVLGIIFMAILTLGTLRYASYVSHEKKNAADRALREAHEADMQRFADTKIDTSAPPDAAEILAAN